MSTHEWEINEDDFDGEAYLDYIEELYANYEYFWELLDEVSGTQRESMTYYFEKGRVQMLRYAA